MPNADAVGNRNRAILPDLNRPPVISISSTFTGEGGDAGKVTYETGLSPYLAKSVVSKLTSQQRDAVQQIGFGCVLQFEPFALDPQFFTWLVDNFDYESHTLNVHGHCINVTAKHVEQIIGFEAMGIDFFSIHPVCRCVFETATQLRIKFSNGQLQLSDLSNSLAELTTAGTEFKVKFVLFILSKLLCPGSTTATGAKAVAILQEVDSIRHINWAKFILDELVSGIKSRALTNTHMVSGCMAFLVVLYLEHFKVVGDSYDLISPGKHPRMKFWPEYLMHAVTTRLRSLGVFDGDAVNVILRHCITIDEHPTHHDKLRTMDSRLSQLYESHMELRQACIELKESVRSIALLIQLMRDDVLLEIRKTTVPCQPQQHADAIAHEMEEEDIVAITRQKYIKRRAVGRQESCSLPFRNLNMLNVCQTDAYELPNQLPSNSKHCGTGNNNSMDVTSPLKKETTPRKPRKSRLHSQSKWSPSFQNNSIGVARRLSHHDCDISSTGSVVLRGRKLRRKDARKRTQFPLDKRTKIMTNPPTPNNMAHVGDETSLPFQAKLNVEMPTAVDCATDPINLHMSDIACSAVIDFESDGLAMHIRARLVEFIFDASKPTGEDLIAMLGQQCTRYHLRSLRPNTWIHGEVLDCFSSMLTIRCRAASVGRTYNVWFLPSILQQIILVNKISMESLYSHYLTEASFGGPLQHCEKICVPMNYLQKHWYLFAVDMLQKKIFLFDSYPVEAEANDREMLCRLVIDRLQQALAYGFGHAHKHDITTFVIETPSWCPKQPNSHDCGMYVMKFMVHINWLVEGFVIKFASLKERMRFALELFCHDCNALRNISVAQVDGLKDVFGSHMDLQH